uniref:Helitron helicase-like domain-containing protein n=1 Tax=Mycena chlorophos TaxID=658473 RepID=A0ABQ0M2R5_MYCCL|nr:predicted protein [Mycena chlorophos]
MPVLGARENAIPKLAVADSYLPADTPSTMPSVISSVIFPSDPMSVSHPNPKYPPAFENSTFTIPFYYDALRTGDSFILFSNIAPHLATALLIRTFKSVRVQDYVDEVQAQVNAGMPWSSFMDGLRTHILGTEWPLRIANELAVMHMGSEESFEHYHLRVNRYLKDTKYYTEDLAMRTLLTSGSGDDLARRICADNTLPSIAEPPMSPTYTAHCLMTLY